MTEKTRRVELVGVQRLFDTKMDRLFESIHGAYEVSEEDAIYLLKKRTTEDRAMFLEVFEDAPETASQAAGDDGEDSEGQDQSKTAKDPTARRKAQTGTKKGGVTIKPKTTTEGDEQVPV